MTERRDINSSIPTGADIDINSIYIDELCFLRGCDQEELKKIDIKKP